MGQGVRRERGRRGASRVLVRMAQVSAATAVVLAVAASPSQAHSTLVSSAPADGSSLESSPARLTLTFDEPVLVDATAAQVMSGVDASVELRPASGGPAEAAVVTMALPALGDGVVRIAWQSLSAIDRHTVDGVIVFGIGGVAVPREAPPVAGPEAMETVARGPAYLGLLLLLGAPVLVMLMRRRLGDRARRDWVGRVMTTAAVGGALALAAECGLLLQTATLIGGDGSLLSATGEVLLSGYGQRWLLRCAALAAVVASLVLLRRRATPTQRRVGTVAFGLAAGAAVVAEALASHVAGHGDALAVPALMVHIAAVSGWFGGLLCLALLVATSVRDAVDRSDALRLLGGFAWLALPAVALAAASGLVVALYEVPTVDALLTTPYGLILVAKTVLVVAAGLLGLRHALQLHRGRVPKAPSRTSLLAEGGLLALAVLLAGALTASAPPRGAEWTTAPPTPVVPITVQPDDLVVTVALSPGAPGDNLVSVRSLNTAVPEPAEPVAVIVRVTGTVDETVRLERAADGGWTAPLTLPGAGEVDLVATLTRPDRPQTRVAASFRVPDTTAARRPVVLSDARTAAPFAILAVLALAGAGAGAVLLLRPAFLGRRSLRHSPGSALPGLLVDPTAGDVPTAPVPDRSR